MIFAVLFSALPEAGMWCAHERKMQSMNNMLLDSYSTTRPSQRYSAKNQCRLVNFMFLAPNAANVSVVGDFNNWQPDIHPMKRMPDGGWTLAIPLHHGHHRYQFLVDGKAVNDPRAQGMARNEKNERVSLIAVS